MPDAVIIENRPLLARLLLMFWVAEIGVGLLFVLAGANMLRFGENSRWGGCRPPQTAS